MICRDRGFIRPLIFRGENSVLLVRFDFFYEWGLILRPKFHFDNSITLNLLKISTKHWITILSLVTCIERLPEYTCQHWISWPWQKIYFIILDPNNKYEWYPDPVINHLVLKYKDSICSLCCNSQFCNSRQALGKLFWLLPGSSELIIHNITPRYFVTTVQQLYTQTHTLMGGGLFPS